MSGGGRGVGTVVRASGVSGATGCPMCGESVCAGVERTSLRDGANRSARLLFVLKPARRTASPIVARRERGEQSRAAGSTQQRCAQHSSHRRPPSTATLAPPTRFPRLDRSAGREPLLTIAPFLHSLAVADRFAPSLQKQALPRRKQPGAAIHPAAAATGEPPSTDSPIPSAQCSSAERCSRKQSQCRTERENTGEAMTALRSTRSPSSRRMIFLGSLLLLGLLLLLLLPSASALRLSSPTYAYPGYPSVSGKPAEAGLYPHTFAIYVEQDPLSYNVTAPIVFLDGTLGGGLNDMLCFPLTADQTALVRGKVVLALRGGGSDCRFFLRSAHAHAAGAAGLIIADNDSADLTFEPQFMGPPADEIEAAFNTPLSDVQIPSIYILYSTFATLTQNNGITGKPNWADTTASLTSDGLVFTMADYEALIAAATKYDGIAKAVTVGFPLVAALYCWAIWLGALREARNSPQQRQQQQQQPAAAPAAGAEQGGAQEGQAPPPAQPPSAADDAAPQDASRVVSHEQGQNQFSEGEMQSLSLPVPPHLSSGDTPADGSSAGSSQSSSAGLVRGSESHRSARSGSLADDEGALLGRAALSDELADHDLASPLPASGSSSSNVGGVHRASALGRPLLPLPAPTVAWSQKFYYHLLKSLSMLGKPLWILRINFVVYLVHAVIAVAVLFLAYGENCISNQTSMVSLWCARAMIGLRICYWQTHSSTFRPTCLDIFFKNWSDCIFLFTGSLSSFSEAQRRDCEINAPITTRWVNIWVIMIFVSYGSKVLLYGCDRLTQHYGSRTPHLFAIASRSFLSVAQGGFSCAGALDAHQPATQLDLMLIPVVSFREGMYPPDDAVCGVCLGEYTAGEELRVLNCTHHFHKGVSDTHRETETGGEEQQTACGERLACARRRTVALTPTLCSLPLLLSVLCALSAWTLGCSSRILVQLVVPPSIRP